VVRPKRSELSKKIERIRRLAAGKPIEPKVMAVYLSIDLLDLMQQAERALTVRDPPVDIVWSKVAARAIKATAQSVVDGQGVEPPAHLPQVTQRERATLRAALLYYRENRAHFGRPLLDVATSSGQHDPLSDDELTALVHRVTKE